MHIDLNALFTFMPWNGALIQGAPENRDAVTKGADGPPDYGYFESAAEFGISITGELEHCCKFGQKSEFQTWMAQLPSKHTVRYRCNGLWKTNILT